jgi:hypothetical protein
MAKNNQSFVEGLKAHIVAGNLDAAERELHHVLLNKDFEDLYGNTDLPVMWGMVSSMTLDPRCPTAMVDLRNGKVVLNPQFVVKMVHTLDDLLFLVMHERDHRLLRRIYRINWGRLSKILDYKEDWVLKVRNAMEDAWINASVRSEMGINATLPERFYCWTQEDVDNPGEPDAENPERSGFDPAKGHVLGQPKSEEYATLTCLSPAVNQDLRFAHEGLYCDAARLLHMNGLNPTNTQSNRSGRRRRSWEYDYSHGSMLSFPEWYDKFCDWLAEHKDDLVQAAPDSEHDDECPQHPSNAPGEDEGEGEGDSPGDDGSGAGDQPGEEGSGSGDGDGDGDSDCSGDGGGSGKPGEGSGSGSASGSGDKPGKAKPQEGSGDDGKGKPTKGDHGHGGNKPCTCKGGNGLFGEPMTVAEALSRIPDIVMSADDLEKILDGTENGEVNRKDPDGSDLDIEVFAQGQGQGASWGGRITRTEIVPKEVEDLSDMDRELLEMGGSALTEAWKTSTVSVKGAVKQYADELVQNIATMRVTEHKIIRPDFNMPTRPSRRDVMRMGMGDMPIMWDTPQYLEQNELVIYTDVSGSMNHWYSVALYITEQLKEFGCEAYQFSTVVCKPRPGVDDNCFIGTGGTHFPAVAEHIKVNGFKAVVILTDNEDCLGEEDIEMLKELPELYAIFLQDSKRPRNLNPETYAWGGSWGTEGWQKATDKITGIFLDDVERS